MNYIQPVHGNSKEALQAFSDISDIRRSLTLVRGKPLSKEQLMEIIKVGINLYPMIVGTIVLTMGCLKVSIGYTDGYTKTVMCTDRIT